jgi:acyl-CoA oxidase
MSRLMLLVGSLSVCVLQVSATIAARYSLRRKVQDHQSGVLQPIISFQTQKTPVLTALSHAFIMQAYQRWAAEAFMSALDPRIQHAIATILKVVMIDLAQASNLTLGDRCGAQGLFEVNQLTAMHASLLYITAIIYEADNDHSWTCAARPLLKAIHWSYLFVSPLEPHTAGFDHS